MSDPHELTANAYYDLQHAFFQGEMHRRLALELLQKVNNPSHMFTDLELDEDGVNKCDCNVHLITFYLFLFILGCTKRTATYPITTDKTKATKCSSHVRSSTY